MASVISFYSCSLLIVFVSCVQAVQNVNEIIGPALVGKVFVLFPCNQFSLGSVSYRI